MRISPIYLVLSALLALPCTLRCQSSEIPGRELLRFPVGLIAEPAALPGIFNGGFWNPAAGLLANGATWRLSAGAMSTPSDVSVKADAGAITGLWRGSSITLSVVRASVAGVVRTDSDPLALAYDLQYSTIVTSVGVARALRPNIAWGVATRLRTGQIDLDRGRALSIDGGIIADHLTRFDARIGASTFLASPWSNGKEHTSFIVGADARIALVDSTRFGRAGVSTTTTLGGDAEQFVYASGRYLAWEIRGGPVRTAINGAENYRARMAIAVHYGGYAVGVAREGSPGGLGPSYQFVLSSVLR